MILRWIKKFRECQRGSMSIEFVAMFPLILFAFLLFWQIALVGYTLVVTEAAARDGARVAAVDGDVYTAVKNSVVGLELEDNYPEWDQDGEEVTVVVKTKVPLVKIPLVEDMHFTITMDATMPYESKE